MKLTIFILLLHMIQVMSEDVEKSAGSADDDDIFGDVADDVSDIPAKNTVRNSFATTSLQRARSRSSIMRGMNKRWPIVQKIREEFEGCFILDSSVGTKVCKQIFHAHAVKWGYGKKEEKLWVLECTSRLRCLLQVAKKEFARSPLPRWIAEFDGDAASPAPSATSSRGSLLPAGPLGREKGAGRLAGKMDRPSAGTGIRGGRACKAAARASCIASRRGEKNRPARMELHHTGRGGRCLHA